MKRLLLLTALFGSVMLSCSKTDIGNERNEDGIIFSGGTEDETKGTYDPGTHEFSWASSDEISIIGQLGTATPYVLGSIYTADKTGKTSTFSPKGSKIEWASETEEHTFYSYYPTNSNTIAEFDATNSDVTISFAIPSEQTQLETNNTDHVYKYTFATSSIKATPSSGNKVGFNFKHHLAFLEFHVSAAANNTMTIKKIEVTATEGIGSAAVKYSFKNDNLALGERYNTATLNFNRAMPVTTAIQKGWLAIAPGAYSKLTFTITYFDGTTQVIERTPKGNIKIGSVISVPLTAAPTKGGLDLDPSALCSVASSINADYEQIIGATIGSHTKAFTEGVGYMDYTADSAIPLAVGDQIKVAVKNNDVDKNNQNVFAHVWVDWDKDGQLTEDEIVGSTNTQKTIKAEQTDNEFLVFNITNQNEETPSGKYLMRMSTNHKDNKGGCSGNNESLTTYDFAIQYDSKVNSNAPAKGRISASNASDLQVSVKDVTVVKTINVTLTKVREEATTINLAVSSTDPLLTGALSTASVTIPAGETSASATITFLPATFTLDKKADITVTASSSNVDMVSTASTIKYTVKGPIGKQDIQFGYTIESNIVNPGYVALRSSYTNKPVGDIILDYDVTGTLTKDDISIDFSYIFYYETSGNAWITLKDSAKGKTGTVTIKSDQITFKDGHGITFTEIK